VTDCATKKLWLAEAELALHKLLTGQAEVTVTFGSGKSVTYTAASIAQLKAYIADLENQVAECDGTTPCKRGPIRFVF
jgi:hypothetical protein